MSNASERNVVGMYVTCVTDPVVAWKFSGWRVVATSAVLYQINLEHIYPMLCMSSQNFWEDFSGRYKQGIQVWNFDFLWFQHWCLSVAGGTGTPILRPHPLKANMFRNMPTNFRGEEISAHAAIVLCPIGWWCPIRAYNTVHWPSYVRPKYAMWTLNSLSSHFLPS
jgi:hypothetical protein